MTVMIYIDHNCGIPFEDWHRGSLGKVMLKGCRQTAKGSQHWKQTERMTDGTAGRRQRWDGVSIYHCGPRPSPFPSCNGRQICLSPWKWLHRTRVMDVWQRTEGFEVVGVGLGVGLGLGRDASSHVR